MFRLSRLGRAICGVCLFALLVSAAWGQTPAVYSGVSQDGSPIPDVNKLNPANPNDGSCWLASASNILAAAGYGGPSGNTQPAQMRAQTIYNQLTTAYTLPGGIIPGGAPDKAMSYWLAWYGKNPNSPEYQPSLAYTDITAKYGTLGQSDYITLKDALYGGQYVGVQFAGPVSGHAVTFVGWDNNQGTSTWTDSDVTSGMGGYDTYANSFSPAWNLNQIGSGQVYLTNANGYVTFCPGLNKDPLMMANYDVAWAPSPNGPMTREAGQKAGIFLPATWDLLSPWSDPAAPTVTFDRFVIDNERDLWKQKHIELLVDYYGDDANYLNEDIRLRYLNAVGMEVVVSPTSRELSEGNGQVLFTWELPIQPEWEEILFPTASRLDYYGLEGRVASWDAAVICVPEPSTLVLLIVMGLGLLGYARRRR